MSDLTLAIHTLAIQDAYDFAAHANPATTHQHYDRRLERVAKATE
jgi:hypothetical protein